MTKVFLPCIKTSGLGQFFQATANHAPTGIEKSLVPVFIKERGRRFNMIYVNMKDGFYFSRCERAEEVDEDGLPTSVHYGYYRLVPAEQITSLRYMTRGCEINFYTDEEGGFIAVTNKESVGPVVAGRIKEYFGTPIEKWLPM